MLNDACIRRVYSFTAKAIFYEDVILDNPSSRNVNVARASKTHVERLQKRIIVVIVHRTAIACYIARRYCRAFYGFFRRGEGRFKGRLSRVRCRDTHPFSSICPRSPLRLNFVPSYFKARSHLMRAYANLDGARSDASRARRDCESTRIQKHRCKKSEKKIYIYICVYTYTHIMHT
jgi:hypothetical protein